MTRAEREKRAQQTVYRIIPEILRSSPRAKHGVSQADLIVDPEPVVKTPTGHNGPVLRPDLTIRVTNADSLGAAARLSERPYATRRTADTRKTFDTRPTVTVHNMASLSRRGGGFLTGSNSQEEFLCARTTLYASLFDQFYALPEVGGVFSPDVLVFRDLNAIDLPKRDRFFINVISSGVPRHPEARGRYDERDVSCTCGVSYCDRDRDIMLRKMKAVMRMAQMKGTKQLILGAWGCGGLNHPVKEVAKLWRRVIAGSARQRRANAEQWEGIEEVVFAIPNPSHAKEFRHVFDDVLAPDYPGYSPSSSAGADIEESAELRHLIEDARSLELQIDTAQSSYIRGRLKEELFAVNHEIALGKAAKLARDDRLGEEVDEDVEDDYVVSGYAGSDGEDNSFYPIDGATSDSGSDGANSGVYEFRFGAQPSQDSQTSQDEDELEDGAWVGFQPSPQFNPQTGWFQGSIDELSAHVLGGGRIRSSASPRSPLRLEPETKNDTVVDGFLARFQRTDVEDQS